MTIALVLPGVAVVWTGLVMMAGVDAGLAGAITLQLAALVVLTLTLAAALARGGALAGALVVLMFVSAQPVAPHWALNPDLDEWRWDALWLGLGTGALLVLALVSRDPAARRRALFSPARPGRRRSSPGPRARAR